MCVFSKMPHLFAKFLTKYPAWFTIKLTHRRMNDCRSFLADFIKRSAGERTFPIKTTVLRHGVERKMPLPCPPDFIRGVPVPEERGGDGSFISM